MSDLAATNCGCGCDSRNSGLFNGNSCGCNIVWILLLLSCCGNGSSCFGGWGNDNCLLILLLLFCCGGNGSDCGCGC